MGAEHAAIGAERAAMRQPPACGPRRPRARWSLAALGCALGLLGPACSGEDVVLGAGRVASDAALPGGADAAAPGEPDGAMPGEPDAGATPRFAEPAVIASLAQADAKDDDPSLSADLTLLYFNSEREGGAGEEDIWFATRASPTDPWRAPQPAAELNSDVRETGIALAPDGLSIWWSSDRAGGAGGLDIYTSARATRGGPWSAPVHVPELSSAADDLVSAVGDAERTVLLARRASEDDDYDLFVARRDDRARPWNEPAPIAELNSDEAESDAFAAEGGLVLLFTRDEDLQLARRPSADAPFGPPVPLDSLNSDGDDRDAWASADLDYVVFSSDRSGSYALYEAAR
jgi:hypothetical protein